MGSPTSLCTSNSSSICAHFENFDTPFFDKRKYHWKKHSNWLTAKNGIFWIHCFPCPLGTNTQSFFLHFERASIEKNWESWETGFRDKTQWLTPFRFFTYKISPMFQIQKSMMLWINWFDRMQVTSQQKTWSSNFVHLGLNSNQKFPQNIPSVTC